MFINPYLLAEPRLYRRLVEGLPSLLRGHASLDWDEVKQIAYASWHRANTAHGDLVFHAHWDQLISRKNQDGSMSLALLGQVARYYLEESSTRLSVRSDRFDEWQSWISNQSALPVIAFQAEKIAPKHFVLRENYHWFEEHLGFRSLISPYHPMVEDYIEQNGLNDTHLHLNGTSSLEAMWHFALNNPQQIVEDLSEKLASKRVRLLYAVHPDLDHPKKYGELLELARRLRQLLMAWVQESEGSVLSDLKQSIVDFLQPSVTSLKKDLVLDLERQYFDCRWPHLAEAALHLGIQRRLKEAPSDVFDLCYLLYLLSINCFQRLAVQRDDQFGFEQFQKFADDAIRDEFEKKYSARFYQLHGAKTKGRPDLLTLEGRFAPKGTSEKNELLITEILRGFLAYAKGQDENTALEKGYDLNQLAKEVLVYRRPTLRLIAHFIKLPWDRTKEHHFKTLREDFREKAKLLFEFIDKYPNLKELITGIDAAANELETPPEVCSVLYRLCRQKGLTRATYHVGEDFENLLTGVRAVFEAVTFLELETGDRLGHATAIGIDPQYWLDIMPDQLFIPQGTRLEDLLFLRHIALERPDVLLPLAHIEAEIHTVASEIFNDDYGSLEMLQQFFEQRCLEPTVVRNIVETDGKDITCIGWLETEYQRAKKVNIKALSLLYKRWFESSTIERYEKRKAYRVCDVSYSVLLKAQQYTQSVIAKKHIILESLPTSNVRISHYHSIKEHHIFRWLQIPERKIEGDSSLLVTLGSDDPGIFATDLRNEFYHLFATLKDHFGYSDGDALALVKGLNENGRIYRFANSQPIEQETKGLAER